VLGARMLADLLRQHGWRVLDLGADIPSHDWVKLAMRFQANLVAISVNMVNNLPTAQSLIDQLRAACPGAFILVGGGALSRGPELVRVELRTLREQPRAVRSALRGRDP